MTLAEAQRIGEHLVEQVKQAPDEAFADQALEAAVVLQTSDSPAYQRLRVAVKRSDAPVGDWDTAVKRTRHTAERASVNNNAEKAGLPVFELGSEVELARALIVEFSVPTADPTHTEGNLWRYDEKRGVWATVDDAAARALITEWDGAPLPSGQPIKMSRSKVDGAVRLAKDIVHDPLFFADAKRGVAFRNVFVCVDLENRTVDELEHAAHHKARLSFSFDFEPFAERPLLDEYLESVFEGDEDATDKVKLLQEFMGAALFGIATAIGKAMLLVGERGSGKTTYIEIAEGLLPENMCCSLNPGDFDNRFKRGHLAGKRLNSSNELPAQDLLREAFLKKIVPGQTTNAERKYVDPFDFKPVAAHLFAANDLPPAPGVSEAFWDRFVAMEFNRIFRGTSKEQMGLAERILETELPGVVAWALGGVQRLVRYQGLEYTIPSSAAALLKRWRRVGNSVTAFFEDCTIPFAEAVVSKWPRPSELYPEYVEFCSRIGAKPAGLDKFSLRAKAAGIEKGRSNGPRLRCRLRVGLRTKSREIA